LISRLWHAVEQAPVSERKRRVAAIGLMAAVAASWAGIELMASFIPSRVSAFQTVWTRYGVHLAFMLLVLGPSQGSHMVRTRRLPLHVFRSLLMLGMPFCYIMALTLGLSAAFVWSVTWLSTPMLLALAGPMLAEQVSALQWAATGFGLLGTWLVIQPALPAPGWKVLLPFGVALSYGLYKLLTRQMRDEATSANLFHTAAWVFLALTIVLPLFWRMPPPRALAAMVGIGIWGFFTLLLLDRALALAPVSITAPFIYTQCIWSALLAWVRHGHAFSTGMLVGAALICSACGMLLAREILGRPPTDKAAALTRETPSMPSPPGSGARHPL